MSPNFRWDKEEYDKLCREADRAEQEAIEAEGRKAAARTAWLSVSFGLAILVGMIAWRLMQ